MTDNPVAAANDRTMWKRETPPIAAISARVNAQARWLSTNQSAFWAGFMDHSLHSKQAHHDRFASTSFDSPCSRRRIGPDRRPQKAPHNSLRQLARQSPMAKRLTEKTVAEEPALAGVSKDEAIEAGGSTERTTKWPVPRGLSRRSCREE